LNLIAMAIIVGIKLFLRLKIGVAGTKEKEI
jgi:hypothetical protein